MGRVRVLWYWYHSNRAGDFTAAINLARVDSGTAQHLLTLLTRDCPTPTCFDRERQYLIQASIPERSNDQFR